MTNIRSRVTNAQRAFAVVVVSLLGAPAFAAGPDFSTLTGAVDFSTVGPALLAIAALMMVPIVVRWGAKRVIAMVGR